MISIILWFQKVKTTVDALWSVACLFCVPGVVITTIGLMLPPGAHGNGGIGSQRFSLTLPELSEPAPKSYSPPAGKGGVLSYRLGLFNSEGELVHEYSDQLIRPTHNAKHGSIVVDIPSDVPSGDYSLRVFRYDGDKVREVPLNVGD